MRYTPSVALYREADGADGLFLDITGASHLASLNTGDFIG